MIWTTVICTECNNPIEIAGGVELPFVCSSCREEAEEFQDAIAPASAQEVEPEYFMGDPGDEHQEPEETPQQEIDAVNDLIASFEEDIATLKEDVAQRDRVIDDLERELAFEEGVTGIVTKLNEDLSIANEELLTRLFREIRFYLNRGFWARVFNTRYKA